MESFAEPDMPEPEPDFGEAPDIEPDFGSVEQAEPDDTSNAENLQAVSITEDIAATPAAMLEEGTDKKESDNNDNAISQQSDFIPAASPEEKTDIEKPDINESEVENITAADSEVQEVPETTDTSEFLENAKNTSNAKPTEAAEASTEAENTDDADTTKISDAAAEAENIEDVKDTEMSEILEPAEPKSSSKLESDISCINEPETELPEICSDIDFGDIDEPDNIVFPEFDYVVEPEIPDPSELPPIESNVISIFDEDWDDDDN